MHPKRINAFYNDLQKRCGIVNSGSKLTWTLTWNDLEKFDNPDEQSRKDSLAIKPEFNNTLKTYQRIPYWEKYSSELIQSSNSMERLIWYLSNPMTHETVDAKIGLFLSLMQTEFAKPSIDTQEIEKYLSKAEPWPLRKIMATNKFDGNFYVFPDIQMEISDTIKFTNVVRVSDLTIKSRLFVSEIGDAMDKVLWERFWQIFNLTQFSTQVIFGDEEISVTESNKYDCLKYHDKDLHYIVKQLIDNNIPFEREGGFFINFENSFAEAMLGFPMAKIVIRPLSLEDRKVFIDAGYTEIEPADFNINSLL